VTVEIFGTGTHPKVDSFPSLEVRQYGYVSPRHLDDGSESAHPRPARGLATHISATVPSCVMFPHVTLMMGRSPFTREPPEGWRPTFRPPSGVEEGFDHRSCSYPIHIWALRPRVNLARFLLAHRPSRFVRRFEHTTAGILPIIFRWLRRRPASRRW
jgi:hypothetical protein